MTNLKLVRKKVDSIMPVFKKQPKNLRPVSRELTAEEVGDVWLLIDLMLQDRFDELAKLREFIKELDLPASETAQLLMEVEYQRGADLMLRDILDEFSERQLKNEEQ